MPRGQKSKLRAREKRRQNKAEPQSPESVQATAGEEEEAACSSSSVLGEASSSPTGAVSLQVSPRAPDTTGATAGISCKRSGKAKGRVQKSKIASQASTSTKSSGQDILKKKVDLVVEYLLCQYKMKQPIKKAEMLKIVHKWYKKDFPEILKRASEHMDLIYGLELKEVKPNGNSYTLVYNPDDTSDGSVSSNWKIPIEEILMPLLGAMFLNGYHAPEEKVWDFLNISGFFDRKRNLSLQEIRELITQDLVREKYVVYQQVPCSDPPRYEFLWGRRAHNEISKVKVLEFVTKVVGTVPTDFPYLYSKIMKEEEQRAQVRAQAVATVSTPSKASGDARDTSSQSPHPK
ncbi:melanoma-associated antigen B4-like [Saccopteryx bilineata]|uniref:melanoma-associated antigen B4-like n=1 Tax=Saccopteryx bilineata TaxID=59482 RepID=UPI00338DE5CA